MPRPSIDEMAATNIPEEALPCIILATLEIGKTAKVASATKCSFAWHPRLMKLVLLLRLLQPRIVERYLTSPKFEDLEPLSDHEGEPFIIRGKVEMQEKMRDDEPGPSSRKRLREAGYEEDDDESNGRLHTNLKKSKQYVIISEEEDELGEPKNDED